MAHSTATTVAEYLESLPSDRREHLSAVRDVILANLPKGYEETISWGMISYEIPLSIYPKTYNKQPLMIAGLVVRKNNNSLHLPGLYGHEPTRKWFEDEWAKTGKKLDMGKGCVYFKTVDDVPLELIGKLIAKIPVETYIQFVEAAQAARKKAV